jgi:hypothetical protein
MTRNKEMGEVMLAVAANAPTLVLRLGVSYLRYKRHAKKAGKFFHRSLVINGIPEKEAQDLTDEYMTSFSIRAILSQLSFRKQINN